MQVSRIRFLRGLAIALIALSPTAQAADPRLDGVPVPLNIDPNKDASPFAGAWFGGWGGQWRTLMVVERIIGQEVEAVYAVGPQGDYEGGGRDLKGGIQDEKLRLNGPN